jgi:hypothetical protein
MSDANFAGCRMGILSRRAALVCIIRGRQRTERACRVAMPRSKRKSAPRLSSGKAFASMALSAPFTSETRALRRNATSGCRFPAPHAQGTETEPIMARAEETSSRTFLGRSSNYGRAKPSKVFSRVMLRVQSLSLSLSLSLIRYNSIYHV